MSGAALFKGGLFIFALLLASQAGKAAAADGGVYAPRSMETAARLRPGELPDYVIFDRCVHEGQEPAFVAGGFFDKFRRPEPPAATGSAAR